MQVHSIAALVVKGADVIGGLISEREIVHAISQHGERALSMAVLEVMTRSAITVTPGDTLKRAMTLMTNHRVRHLQQFPVDLNQDGFRGPGEALWH